MALALKKDKIQNIAFEILCLRVELKATLEQIYYLLQTRSISILDPHRSKLNSDVSHLKARISQLILDRKLLEAM